MTVKLNWADKTMGLGSAFAGAASVLYHSNMGNTFNGATDEATFYKALAWGAVDVVSALLVGHLLGKYTAYGRAYLRAAEEEAKPAASGPLRCVR